jgi:organic hydroperoxide reductase OsmC/OhrA
MAQEHLFEGDLRWIGSSRTAESGLAIERRFRVEFAGKAPIEGSSPVVFKGDDAFHNPETLMVASLMACHHLTYLALCERSGIALADYTDHASGRLGLREGRMQMVGVTLRPRVRVARASDAQRALELHAKAHANCFMSNSVNFEVTVEPAVKV